VGELCERELDLAAVEELLEHRGGVLLIEGRAGIGHTLDLSQGRKAP
jgi:hypothetical protein